jgi:hypothetical protein
VNLGIQQRSALEDFDLTYGFALRLGDERLVIRGEGVYTGGQAYSNDRLQGALTVEYQLNDNVLLELFYRREDDFLQTSSAIGTAYGAGLVYQTEFANWKQFRQRIRGQNPSPNEANPPEEPVTAKNEGSGGEKP